MANKKKPTPQYPPQEHSPKPAIPDEHFNDEALLKDFAIGRSAPTRREIEAENQAMVQRQSNFRIAAEHVAKAFSTFEEVQKVVLFGSVALPLEKEVPRFREYRRAGIAIFHECSDVDLAVWVTRLDNLNALRRIRSQSLNSLNSELGIGVAHHQVEVFLMEPTTDRYLGRLCCFNECPKAEKIECRVPGCGEHRFLKRIPSFRMQADALHPMRSEVLFERITT